MASPPRLVAAVLAGVIVALTPMPVAAAEPVATVASVRPSGSGLDVQIQAANLPEGTTLSGDGVAVRLDGEGVRATVRNVQSTRDPATTRRVALVVDTSGSMAGAPLSAARAAASAYLEAVPADVEVGLLTFAAGSRLVVAPTTNRRSVASALPRLQAAGGTSLYDAVVHASRVVGEGAERRVVVLSDGDDSTSKADLAGATASVRESGLSVDAVSLGKHQPAVAALTTLASSGGGRVLRAGDEVEAVRAFQEAARAFSATLRMHVEVPRSLAAQSAQLEVKVKTSDDQVLRATVPVVLPEAAASPGFLSSGASLALGGTALFVGLAAVLFLAVNSGDSQAQERRRAQQVLASYTLRVRPSTAARVAASRIGDGALANGALALAGRLLRGRPLEARLTARLERAALRFTAREWLVLHTVITVMSLLVLSLLAGPVAGLLAAGLAAGAVNLWLSMKGQRRATAFEAAMPDALQLVASGLSTGYSLPQALDAVVNDGQPPFAEELGRALAEARLGVNLENALDKVAERMRSRDFHWVVMAIRVQREVGGNLSEVLRTLCQTMRDRNTLRRQIKALSAEGRLGAIILICLPFFVGAYLSLMNPDFFRPMLETTVGLTLLAGSGVAMGLGALWMKQIIKVEA